MCGKDVDVPTDKPNLLGFLNLNQGRWSAMEIGRYAVTTGDKLDHEDVMVQRAYDCMLRGNRLCKALLIRDWDDDRTTTSDGSSSTR